MRALWSKCSGIWKSSTGKPSGIRRVKPSCRSTTICVITSAHRVSRIGRQSLAGMLKTAPYTIRDFTIGDDGRVRLLSNDAAVVAYTVHEELTVDGKPAALDAADASTWMRRDGGWVCAPHTESLKGDPFGRDRLVHQGA